MDAAVRTAERRDAERIADLQVRTALFAFADIFPADAPAPKVTDLTLDWKMRLAECGPRPQAGFVVEDAGTLVGVSAAGPDPDHPDLGHLSRLYVDPNHWNEA